MIPATIDFQCRTNADYGEELLFADGEVPLNLTGVDFKMEVRRYPNGPLLFEVPIGPLDALNGIVSLGISRRILRETYDAVIGVQSGAVAKMSHDIIGTQVDGFVDAWAQGTFVIEAGVTLDG